MPGSKPPSATPKRARTVTKDAKLRTKPRHMVKMPHTAVNSGSQILGDIFLSTKFEGNSLCHSSVPRHTPHRRPIRRTSRYTLRKTHTAQSHTDGH
jgi:hypothetical protein